MITSADDEQPPPSDQLPPSDQPARFDRRQHGQRRRPRQRPGQGPQSRLRPLRSPARLDRQAWKGVMRRAIREYRADDLSDWAAALTYRAILSLFPGLLVLVAIIGLLGHSASERVLTNVNKHAPSGARPTIRSIVENAQHQHSAASVIGIIALLVALWSASGFVAAFMRASNAIYDIGEGRPIWKLAPVRLGVTIFLVVAVVVSAAIALLSRGIAHDIGDAIGLGSTAVSVWGIVKWPLLVVIACLTLSVLYWAAPNVKQPGFTWISPGGALSVVIWAAASGGFAVYVANFASYNKTYGSLAGIVVFLVWLWISNMALLLGAEFNSELQRARAIESGLPETQEPYVDLRDTKKLDATDRERAEALSRHLHSFLHSDD
ncbi:MAG: YihY/virulence factor BrkB family protein [Acidothermaceae bacterium]